MKKSCLFLATFFGALISLGVHAQEKPKPKTGEAPTISKDDLAKCQAEENGTKRLGCYDLLLPPNEIQSPEEKSDTGKWQVSTVESDIDDSTNVFAMLTADLPISSNFGRTSTPVLFITCREKKTELFINWDVYLGLGETSMLHRLDKQKAVTKVWDISGNTKAVFYRGRTIDFIKSLEKSGKMLAQITPYNENSATTTFDLKGLSEAIKPLQKSCGWK
ncbi:MULTISPECIES: type VI secretion system-associated protein TagO [Klebsiella/Raoultella group]|uniref:type VI secretion system-associated protein TagO n=1 Tax=Klebsiella/Raoultella group TaxID=2890311 RepID=UPI000EF1B0D6|nr:MULTISPECIES: type VI secretion system-associated protein TagO [Klebsiella/Raoultella group]MDC7944196.1 type VI secretion protein [Raoultella ornithinolytica]MDZ1464118.1 type VI secretion protein [Klebsiella quasipneumoniae]RLL16549.1 type VI secretion protein [Klebsiella pneumoniae]VAN94987.1 type VI secretion-associated protein, VC_A0118 family [Klebsiella pneumoniae]VAO68434.1 type VI secretion-associated protein, VC_A0118 family [Klebsiella pneumoniae]